MEKIIIPAYVRDKLNEILLALYEDEYSGFIESAFDYIDRIYDFIHTVPQKRHWQARNTKYGSYYCKYKHNNNIMWFVTFDIENDLFLIRNIINNHSIDYPTFISGLIEDPDDK